MPKLTSVDDLAANLALLDRIATSGTVLAREIAGALGPGPARDHVIAFAGHLAAAGAALAPVADAVRRVEPDGRTEVVH